METNDRICRAAVKKATSTKAIKATRLCPRSEAEWEAKIKIKGINSQIAEGMELAFDSTGVNVYNRSGWHQRKYAEEVRHKKNDQWKKIHVVLELNSMEIVAVTYTASQVNDCEEIEALSRQIEGEVTSIRADSAYDTEKMYKKGYDWGAKMLIPPGRRARMQEEIKKRRQEKKVHLEQRDEIIRQIRGYTDFDEGLKAWKKSSGYHRRSLVESCMNRIKKTFGFCLQQRTEPGRANEVITKANLLNLMASLARAEYSS